MDNPTKRLDKQTTTYMLQELNKVPKEGEEAPANLLSKKTRVFVTDDVAFLKSATKIIYMEEGRVAKEGTFKQLKDLQYI